MLRPALKRTVSICSLLLTLSASLLSATAAFAQLLGNTPENGLSTTGIAVIEKPLPADQAFVLSILPNADGQSLQLHWLIKRGYYLYRKSLSLGEDTPVSLDKYTSLPDAEKIEDEFFGESAVYFNELSVDLPLSAVSVINDTVQLTLSYQGCAEDLYCYPPVQKQLTLVLP